MLGRGVGGDGNIVERACKPGSVFVRSSIWDECCHSPLAALPGGSAGNLSSSVSALLQVGFAGPTRLRAAGALLPHHFTLTPSAPASGETFMRGRYLSVALSVGSPRPAVSRHPALRSPDFPRRPESRRDRPARSEGDCIRLSQTPSFGTLLERRFASSVLPRQARESTGRRLSVIHSLADVEGRGRRKGQSITFVNVLSRRIQKTLTRVKPAPRRRRETSTDVETKGKRRFFDGRRRRCRP